MSLISKLSIFFCHGVIAGLANLAPKACVRVMELYQKGDATAAREMQAVLARGDWIAIKGGFVAVKVGLESYYGYGGLPRRPCALPAAAELSAMREAFAELMALEKSL